MPRSGSRPSRWQSTAAAGRAPPPAGAPAPSAWSCSVCTFQHEGELAQLPACSVCGTPRPAGGGGGPPAASRAGGAPPAGAPAAAAPWVCGVCTYEHAGPEAALTACSVCAAPRAGGAAAPAVQPQAARPEAPPAQRNPVAAAGPVGEAAQGPSGGRGGQGAGPPTPDAPARWTCKKCTYTHEGAEAERTTCALCGAPRQQQAARSRSAGRPPPSLRSPSAPRTPRGAAGPAAEEGVPCRVQILGARGLPPGGAPPGARRPNPYCRCEVPMKQPSRVQTPVARETSEPAWGHEAEVPGFARGDALQFTVYDRGARSEDGDAVLGTARLQPSEIQAGFDGELPLAAVSAGAARLRVKVACGPAAAAAPAAAASRRPWLQVPGRPSPGPPASGRGGAPASEPRPEALKFADPRSTLGREVGVVAFHHCGKSEAWDELCGASFLGNHFDLGRGGLQLESPLEPGRRRPFANAEAAFQALHFWPLAADFAELPGEQALQRRRQLRGREDPNCAGLMSDWRCMEAVLEAKFAPGTALAASLLATREAFLLAHPAAAGGDAVWSGDGTGEGRNWLGLQLMLLRDRRSAAPSWTGYLEQLFDTASGQPLGAAQAQRWQAAVRAATEAVVGRFGGGRAPPAQAPPAEASQGRFPGGSFGPSLPSPLRPLGSLGGGGGAPGGGRQWAGALALLGPLSTGTSSNSGASPAASWPPSSQWPLSLSMLGGPASGALGRPPPASSSQQWSSALGLLQQWQRSPPQTYAGSRGYPGSLPLKDRPWGPPGAAFPAAPPATAPWGRPQPWGGPAPWGGLGGSPRWSQALGLLDSPWGQQQQLAAWRGPPASLPPSAQLTPEALAILPEAVSGMSETASQHSQASSELSHVQAARTLYRACQEGDLGEVRRCLGEGLVSPDCRNPRGATPLFAAAFGNHADVVRLLLEHRADADRTNNDSATPAFIAAQRDSAPALQLLLRARADPDRSRKDRATPTFIAAANCSAASLELLLKARADPDLANKNGDTPLSIAAYSSHVHAVQLLIGVKANVNAPGYRGQENALDCATRAQASASSEEARARADVVLRLLRAAGALPMQAEPAAVRGAGVGALPPEPARPPQRWF